MRDEVRRINKLVAEGKLSPEDAADLIDAFYANDRDDQDSGPTPPPPPPGAPNEVPPGRDPFKSLIDQIEKLTKEGVDSVDWKEVSRHARDSAKKGMDFLRVGLEDISKGKVNLNFFGAMETREVMLPLAIGEGKSLKVENACGDVQITGGESTGSVIAHARFRGGTIEDARAKAQAYTVVLEESDHQVIVRQLDVPGLSVDLEITIAGSAAVEVKTSAGDVEVHGTGAGVRATVGAGDLRISGAKGPVEINSGSGNVSVEDSDASSLIIENKSGDIRLSHVAGNMNVRTASGDLTVEQASGKVVALESISGDVTVDLLEAVTGSLTVRTVNGDASIGIPDGSDARVTLATLRGSVSCGLELSDKQEAPQRITGKVGEGTGAIDISAVTGDVRLEMRKTEAAPV